MSEIIYYLARVFTNEHKQVAGLPMHAAIIMVELAADKEEGAIAFVGEVAGGLFRSHFHLTPATPRNIETDEVRRVSASKPIESHYQNENGRAWIVENLLEKHPQR